MTRGRIVALVIAWLSVVLALSFRALTVGTDRVQSGRNSFNPSLTTARAEKDGLPDIQAPPFAHGAAVALAGGLMQELTAALAEGDAVSAIGVCGEAASRIAAEVTEEKGVEVSRVALGLRNPANVPDAWERAWLEASKGTRGENPAVPIGEYRTLPDGRMEYAYLMPIYTAPLCLQCHGGPTDLGPGVPEALAKAYPHDQATGFELGSLRGAVRVRFLVRETEAGQFK